MKNRRETMTDFLTVLCYLLDVLSLSKDFNITVVIIEQKKNKQY